MVRNTLNLLGDPECSTLRTLRPDLTYLGVTATHHTNHRGLTGAAASTPSTSRVVITLLVVVVPGRHLVFKDIVQQTIVNIDIVLTLLRIRVIVILRIIVRVVVLRVIPQVRLQVTIVLLESDL